eukprot:scaffold112916_cov76-Cyclotella_meneghiniana.AAC.5
MFLNNASALATRTPRHRNNENATTNLRAKSLASSDSNNILAVKTPKNKEGTQQRRRRALGDISNRKNGLGGGGVTNNKNGLSVKKQQQQIGLKPKVVNFATPSNQQSVKSVVLKQTPTIHIDPIQESKHGQEEPEHDYDLVLGRTTRWSTDHEDENDRSPFDYMSKEELFMADTLLEEMHARKKEKIVEEQRRMEAAYEEKLREASECWDAGLEHADLGDGVYDDEVESLKILHQESWDVEDGSDDVLNLLNELDF